MQLYLSQIVHIRALTLIHIHYFFLLTSSVNWWHHELQQMLFRYAIQAYYVLLSDLTGGLSTSWCCSTITSVFLINVFFVHVSQEGYLGQCVMSSDLPAPNLLLPLDGDDQSFLGTDQDGEQTVNEFIWLLFPEGDIMQSLKTVHLKCLNLSLCICQKGPGFAAVQQMGMTRDLYSYSIVFVLIPLLFHILFSFAIAAFAAVILYQMSTTQLASFESVTPRYSAPPQVACHLAISLLFSTQQCSPLFCFYPCWCPSHYVLALVARLFVRACNLSLLSDRCHQSGGCLVVFL